jgi:RNA-binding protein
MSIKKGDTKLSGASLRHLRALGHALEPVVMIGKEGITESLVRAANAALLTHELIKVKVQSEAPVERKEAAAALADASEAVLAQVLGRTFLLYKRHPKKPKIKLPKASPPA